MRVNEEKDSSLTCGQSSPTSTIAVTHRAESIFPDFMYATVHISTDIFDLSGHALLDTGSNVGLIDVNLLPNSIVSRLTPMENKVQGVGGATTVRGTVSGTVRLGEAIFSNINFQIVDRITDDVQLKRHHLEEAHLGNKNNRQRKQTTRTTESES